MTSSETKQCQNCQQNFVIEPEDFEFYDKIKVPPPTWCPECRLVRRMVWRNERTLYHRKCDAPGHEENIISVYSADKPFVVYDYKYWWGDSNDPMQYGQEYDFSRPFFAQMGELFKQVPQINLVVKNNVNSDYVHLVADSKDCYLLSGGWMNERTLYANHLSGIKDSLDLYFVDKLELSYECGISQNSYQLFYGQNCDNCLNSSFLYDCKNCSHCFGCVGLRNKQYHIFNQPLSKDDYEKKIKAFDLGSFNATVTLKAKYRELILKYPHKFANTTRTEKSTGDNIKDAKNCQFVFDILGGAGGSEDSKFVFWAGQGMRDVYDGIGTGVKSELLYEGVATGISVSKVLFSITILESHDVYYSYNCFNSSNLFGCIGLRNKSYCILNQQYTKEAYEELVPKIIQHMNDMPFTDQKGRVYQYGEFFPPELSPFNYNETIAQEYFPLTQEQALEKGYSWKEPEERNIKITKKTEDLPDHIKDVPDTITQEIIECQHQGHCQEQCTTAFKIINPELAFYRQMNLPLPRLCPNCRHYQRLKQRNPLKLWHRSCQCSGEKSSNGVYQNTVSHSHGNNPCPTEFETSYAPERPEIVYCEQCYQQEVV